jgi:hypothetical protein
MSIDLSVPRGFTPERIPRRGEFIAWILAFVALLTGIILLVNGFHLPTFSWILLLFLVIVAASISLSNWMDRQSLLTIDSEGLSFRNGLRNIHLLWGEIDSIQVRQGQWGARKIQVIGLKDHFTFHTLGTIRYRGEIKGQTGFAMGDEIFDTMLKFTGFQRTSDQSNSSSYYVYK